MTGEATRTLILLRHAKAAPVTATGDESRPLDPAGRQQCFYTGQTMHELGLRPSLVLCSGARRARLTWQLVSEAMAGLGELPDMEVDYLDALYRAYVPELLEVLNEVGDEHRTVVVVGHQPTMSATAMSLVDPARGPQVAKRLHDGLPTGAFAVIRDDRSWSHWGGQHAEPVGFYPPAQAC